MGHNKTLKARKQGSRNWGAREAIPHILKDPVAKSFFCTNSQCKIRPRTIFEIKAFYEDDCLHCFHVFINFSLSVVRRFLLPVKYIGLERALFLPGPSPTF